MSSSTTNQFVAINDHSLLLLKGPDAKKFLQGQVTCDIDALSWDKEENQTSLGAHCTHKGRMLFSFRACQLDDDTIGLSIYKDLIPDALAALKKYSVFSKVELIDGSSEYTLLGYSGDNISALKELFPTLPGTADYATHDQGTALILLSDKRYECWLAKQQASELIKEQSIATDTNSWTALNIAEGIGEVRPETVEEFIPQMLNYQEIANGISFSKGCYTGQEVVARMHYLGKLKRHMYRFSSEFSETITAGTPLFKPNSTQSIGNVVISASTNKGQELLAVVTEEAFNQDQVYLDKNCHHKLQALTLPYAITKEVT